MTTLDTQIGGNHYGVFRIQPVEFIRANGLNFCEGNVIKYTIRRKNNRLEDLKKARHYIDMLIEDEEMRLGTERDQDGNETTT